MAGRSFVPNPGSIDALLHSPNGPVWQHLNAFGHNVERIAKRNALVETGRLRASIHSTPPQRFGPAGLELVVGSSDSSAMVIHQGHKELTTPTPRGKSRYKFQPKGSSKYVYAKKVRAVGGVPFLTAALKEANAALPADVRFVITIHPPLPRTEAPPRGAPRL